MLHMGEVGLDRRHMTVTVGGTALRLTRTEFRLLAALLEARPGEVVSRRALALASRGSRGAEWGWPADRYVSRLRAALRRTAAEAGVPAPTIEAVRTFGYRLTA